MTDTERAEQFLAVDLPVGASRSVVTTELARMLGQIRADERAACVAFLRARATRLLWQHGLVRNLTIRTMGLAVDEAATALENGWTLREVKSDG